MQSGFPRSDQGSEPRSTASENSDERLVAGSTADSESAAEQGNDGGSKIQTVNSNMQLSSAAQNKRRSGNIISSQAGLLNALSPRSSGGEVSGRTTYDGPDRRSEAHANKSSGNASPAGRVEYDSHGRVSFVAYPGGCIERSFERDANGNVIAVGTRDADGLRTITNANGRWYTIIEGQYVTLPGTIFVNSRGDFSTQVSADGLWRTEKPDGSTVEERSTTIGARITFDSHRRLQQIVRKDGSWINAVYRDGRIVEILEAKSQNGRITRWQCRSEVGSTKSTSWVSNHEPPQTRKNLELHDNANTSWVDEQGLHHVVRGSGILMTEIEGGTRFRFDKQGRIEAIEYAGGQRTRRFTYEPWSSEINRVTLIDNLKGSKSYQQVGPDNWLVTDETGKKYGTWRGQVSLTDDGCYGVKNLRAPAPDRFGHWKTYAADGTEAREYRSQDGARAVYDTSGRLQTIHYTCGLRIDAHYESGRLHLLTELSANGTVETWRKGSDDTWSRDAGQEAGIRKNIGFNKVGEMYFLDGDDRQHTILTSGLNRIRVANGSTLLCDASGLVLHTHTATGEQRTFDYDDQKQLVRVTSNTADGGKDVWRRKADDHVDVTADGDIRVKAADGRVVALEKSNFERLDFDQSGHVVKVTNPDGSSEQAD